MSVLLEMSGDRCGIGWAFPTSIPNDPSNMATTNILISFTLEIVGGRLFWESPNGSSNRIVDRPVAQLARRPAAAELEQRPSRQRHRRQLPSSKLTTVIFSAA